VESYIAIDLGASSGRVMVGQVGDGRIALEEIHRFENGPMTVGDSIRWNFSGLINEIKAGLAKAISVCEGPISGIGVDSWGVDFGLIDAEGTLIEEPYHYRDSRNDPMMQRAYEVMGRRKIYEHSGIQFIAINSLYQLMAAKNSSSDSLHKAKHLVFIADLVSYFLCGEIVSEYSLASTSQLLDMRKGQWSEPIFEQLDLPIELMSPVVMPGTVIGKLTEPMCRELNCDPIEVIAIGSHDTASAVAAIPVENSSWAYLSSGTWSLMGVEIPEAIVNEQTYGLELTNEGGVDKTIRLLKNIMGLWLVQECRTQWQREGEEFGHGELVTMAQQAQPFAGRINPNESSFAAPGDMPGRLNDYLKRTGQSSLENKGQLIRVVLESLAMIYRVTLEKLEQVTGQRIDVLHIVGGGIQNELLCQFTANALGRKVITGPVEATALGNIMMQAKAKGTIESLAQGRKFVRQSIEVKEYQPSDVALWDREYQKSKQLLDKE
jgi:rhamnulokinase